VLTVWAIPGIPEIAAGDDLPGIIAAAAVASGVVDGDILVVTSKIVSKAEGRIVAADDREDAITAETVRVVAELEHPGGRTRIVENRQGLVLAAAGVDASNTPHGTVLLLPVDPDASAHVIRDRVLAQTGAEVGVVISDTFGRPWRVGQTDVAIGAAGVHVTLDLRGSTDTQGRSLAVTVPAVGDELAAAADLVKGKASGMPVAIVRGMGHLLAADAPGARSLQRPSAEDLFRLGAAEAWREGFTAGRAVADRAPGSLRWSVVIPIKPSATGKSRLVARDRESLARAIALDTLAAVLACPSVAEAIVVTSDAAVALDAHRLGARVVDDEGVHGLAAAIALGLASVPADHARAVLLGDLPALRSDDLAAALHAAEGMDLATVPDADGVGTTLVTARPGVALEPRFGADSAAAHRATGFTPLPVTIDSTLRHDVDTLEQLAAAAQLGLGPRTAAALAAAAAAS
jgi:coenzyme F420-0:L-glutamate ligase/coenzyme F420-1:gamma-L-glutamate ligase